MLELNFCGYLSILPNKMILFFQVKGGQGPEKQQQRYS